MPFNFETLNFEVLGIEVLNFEVLNFEVLGFVAIDHVSVICYLEAHIEQGPLPLEAGAVDTVGRMQAHPGAPRVA